MVSAKPVGVSPESFSARRESEAETGRAGSQPESRYPIGEMRWFIVCIVLLTLTGCDRSGDDARRLLEGSRGRLAQLEGNSAVEGLEHDVEVLRDKWGVAHVYADTVHDLFFAQGYVAAQDRLYQIEIWRRTGAGKLAEVFGPKYVDRDRIASLVFCHSMIFG